MKWLAIYADQIPFVAFLHGFPPKFILFLLYVVLFGAVFGFVNAVVTIVFLTQKKYRDRKVLIVHLWIVGTFWAIGMYLILTLLTHASAEKREFAGAYLAYLLIFAGGPLAQHLLLGCNIRPRISFRSLAILVLLINCSLILGMIRTKPEPWWGWFCVPWTYVSLALLGLLVWSVLANRRQGRRAAGGKQPGTGQQPAETRKISERELREIPDKVDDEIGRPPDSHAPVPKFPPKPLPGLQAEAEPEE